MGLLSFAAPPACGVQTASELPWPQPQPEPPNQSPGFLPATHPSTEDILQPVCPGECRQNPSMAAKALGALAAPSLRGHCQPCLALTAPLCHEGPFLSPNACSSPCPGGTCYSLCLDAGHRGHRGSLLQRPSPCCAEVSEATWSQGADGDPLQVLSPCTVCRGLLHQLHPPGPCTLGLLAASWFGELGARRGAPPGSASQCHPGTSGGVSPSSASQCHPGISGSAPPSSASQCHPGTSGGVSLGSASQGLYLHVSAPARQLLSWGSSDTPY